MPSLNKVQLIGHLGKDPELKYTSSGKAVCNFSIATTEKRKDQSYTTWHNIVMWGKLAEVANQYLKKGSPVYLEGRIDNRSYDDRDGNKRYVSEVVVNNMVMFSNRDQGQQPAGGGNQMPDMNDDSESPF